MERHFPTATTAGGKLRSRDQRFPIQLADIYRIATSRLVLRYYYISMAEAVCVWLIMRMGEPMLFPTFRLATALGIPNHFWKGDSIEHLVVKLTPLSQHKVLQPITHPPGDVKSAADVLFRPAATGSTSLSTLYAHHRSNSLLSHPFCQSSCTSHCSASEKKEKVMELS